MSDETEGADGRDENVHAAAPNILAWAAHACELSDEQTQPLWRTMPEVRIARWPPLAPKGVDRQGVGAQRFGHPKYGEKVMMNALVPRPALHFLAGILFALLVCLVAAMVAAPYVADDQGVQILTRGPIHEAFAAASMSGSVIARSPCEPTREVPPPRDTPAVAPGREEVRPPANRLETTKKRDPLKAKRPKSNDGREQVKPRRSPDGTQTNLQPPSGR